MGRLETTQAPGHLFGRLAVFAQVLDGSEGKLEALLSPPSGDGSSPDSVPSNSPP